MASVLATSENVIRVTFDGWVKYTGVLDDGDASNSELYTVTPGPGIGLDGNLAWPVRVVLARKADPYASFTDTLELVTDRPMAHWPASYYFSSANVGSAIYGYLADIELALFYGLHETRVSSVDAVTSTARDIAMTSSTFSNDKSLLGAFQIAEDGDYKFDQGLDNYRKRVWRRIITRPGGFAHLGLEYGAGVPQSLKKLATASELARLGAIVEKQVLKEPETVRCKATLSTIRPGLYLISVLAQTKPWGSIKMPFNVTIL